MFVLSGLGADVVLYAKFFAVLGISEATDAESVLYDLLVTHHTVPIVRWSVVVHVVLWGSCPRVVPHTQFSSPLFLCLVDDIILA